KKNSTLLFLFISVLTLAQSKRIYYQVTFKLDSSIVKNDIVVLEINKDSNLFLSNDYIITDSLNSLTNYSKPEFAYPKFNRIIKYYKTTLSYDFINNLSSDYYIYRQEVNLKWNLTDIKKKIGAFNVQKATTEYGGRQWVAWFSQDIPYPYGPYVFNGLPGLILEIYDDKENYKFSFYKNKNYETNFNLHRLDALFGNQKINIKNSDDWKKIQIDYYNNPLKEYKNGDAYMTKESGEEYTTNDYKNLENNIKNQIKKYNNPIELNEKIDYK
ncbi:GLPGLI family protein, partial [Kaistella sp.]|uniref:GLPGLI family protein n=1 Tax=Kaistella sp. TaxID=2782235 RepID=UPI003C6803BC